MFSGDFYSCPLLLLAITYLGLGAEFCRRGIKEMKLKSSNHPVRDGTKFFIISQNHAVLCRTDLGT